MKTAFATSLAALLVLATCAASAQTLMPGFGPPTDPRGAAASGGSPAPAEPGVDVAFGAYQRGFYITAFRTAMQRVAANPRDAAAMTLIGEIYRDGYAVKQDTGEASHWYRLASGLGDREAAFALGALLLNGAPGVPRDRDAARAPIRRSLGKPASRPYRRRGRVAQPRRCDERG